MQQMVETRNVSWSVVLHVVVLLIAAFGLPILLPKSPDPVPMVMSIELLPISELTNVKPSDQPLQKAQNKPTPTPPKPVPPAPPTPKVAPTPPAPTPPPPTPKSFNPDEGAEVQDTIKPVEKPKPPQKTDAQKQQEEFQKTLDALKNDAAKAKPTPAPAVPDAKDKANVPANLTKSDQPYNDAMPMSQTEKDAISGQFIPCWSMPSGAKDANKLAVRVKVTLQPDGTVIDAIVAPDQLAHYNADLTFRAAADSAVRAVHKCSPLKYLPSEKYNSWKDMEINFDPKDLP